MSACLDEGSAKPADSWGTLSDLVLLFLYTVHTFARMFQNKINKDLWNYMYGQNNYMTHTDNT